MINMEPPHTSTFPPPPSNAMASAAPIPLSKLAFAAGSATLLLGFLVPISDDLLATTSPPLLSTLDTYLSPPYLFLAVNLIILAIWKLSPTAAPEPTREFVTAATSEEADDEEQPKNPSLITREKEEAATVDRGPGGNYSSDSSCVTSDTEEGPPEVPTIEETWRAIRGAAGGPRKVAASSVADEEEVVVCTDEMDRRFEAFIKKVNDQMRLQRHE